METPRLPQEIVEEIFQRLPVKALLRFKCLSKSSNRLISSHAFARLHCQQTSQVSTANQMILTSTCSGLKFLDPETEFGKSEHFKFKLKRKFPPQSNIIGSCNGLVAVTVSYKDLFLWNPSTGDYRKLPEPFHRFPLRDYVLFYGFGYDSSSDDYKVFYGFQLLRMPRTTEASIYSLRRNSWRLIQPHPAYAAICGRRPQPGPFVNGALHWLCGNHEILAFDIKMESFSTMPIPNLRHDGLLGAVDGKLSMYACNTGLNATDLWVMREYGVYNSWTKLLILPNELHDGVNLPLFITKGNAVISIDEYGGLTRCNLDGTKYERFRICECNTRKRCTFLRTIVHAESLISLNNISGKKRKRQGRKM